ncbi:adenosylcobinamide-GDP ribazoletransferase [Mucilaginibacter sp. X4EP1]|uniref:adenosylcobinamide-GDP ribazoletransferase n=1 Tax=Mucilaginibacter sp. X4EP1 TaxID=2723092 RepID=UPI002167E36A|nr:adenosylcobinamide-GDP ribazoletransferase [Mucilaginibacter sp. X4EP1]MCS3815335.1 adenosylcobinamide-GDP ribazoletransferase [Mucilaginibacter sp. X4EP1]
MKKEIRIFFTALMFFTRIPCPKWVDHSKEYLNKSSRYFPMVGILVGSISALFFYGFQFILPKEIALLLSMVASVLTTGAFHEDGFADVCDGFGGGWTKEKILLIMKDSRLGTYGVIGVGLILLLKWTSLNQLPAATIVITLIAGHTISRLNAVSLIFTDEYAREDDTSKTKPLATKMSTGGLVFAIITGLLPLLLFNNVYVCITLLPLLLVRWYFSWYFKKWIGGYTGDCLGAVQQLSEVVFYISLLVIFKYAN